MSNDAPLLREEAMDATAKVVALRPAAPSETLEQRQDDDLMRLARAGMPAAFDVLVRRHQRSVLNVACKELGGDVDAAKDAAQQTFLELYRYLPRYEPRGRLRSLLFRILCNHCRGVGRKRRITTTETELLQHAASTPMVEEALLNAEQRREVERLVDGLSPKLRMVVLLRFAGDLSYEEISDVLDVPLGTVKSRLFAALGQLHSRLTGGAQ